MRIFTTEADRKTSRGRCDRSVRPVPRSNTTNEASVPFGTRGAAAADRDGRGDGRVSVPAPSEGATAGPFPDSHAHTASRSPATAPARTTEVNTRPCLPDGPARVRDNRVRIATGTALELSRPLSERATGT
ncbi:hypothetical protein GCM10009678_34060 [Actinomadura kijaniata]